MDLRPVTEPAAGVPRVQVVRIEARADVDTPEDFRARLEAATPEPVPTGPPQPARWPGRALTATEVDAEVAAFARSLHVDVTEVAVLSDGREVVLLDDRGWSSSGPSPEEQWARLDVAAVEQDVRNVVLPDDAEVSGEEHEWQVFADALARAGVAADVAALREVPYAIVLSERLLARLT